MKTDDSWMFAEHWEPLPDETGYTKRRTKPPALVGGVRPAFRNWVLTFIFSLFCGGACIVIDARFPSPQPKPRPATFAESLGETEFRWELANRRRFHSVEFHP